MFFRALSRQRFKIAAFGTLADMPTDKFFKVYCRGGTRLNSTANMLNWLKNCLAEASRIGL